HRILSVHLDPLLSAAVTTSGMHPSPRALTLAASIGWRHAAADPVRALLLASRVLRARLAQARRAVRTGGGALGRGGPGRGPGVAGRLAAPAGRLRRGRGSVRRGGRRRG